MVSLATRRPQITHKIFVVRKMFQMEVARGTYGILISFMLFCFFIKI